MGIFYELKNDNKGLTLVELLVTLAVSAVVAGSVAAIIGFSVNTYHNENVNTELQYEVQMNVNQIMDTIMASSGAVIVEAGGKTDYAGFGKFNKAESGNITFDGTVFVTGGSSGELYMVKGTAEGPTAVAAVGSVVTNTVRKAGADKRLYLMGQNVKVFNISIDTNTTTSSCIVSSTEYINPLTVDVELEFEKAGSGTIINKKVKDRAVIRNKVTADIYVNGNTYKLKK